MTNSRNSPRRAALLDILLVVLVSAVAYTIELASADVLPWGDEARGVVAVLVGAGFAIWVTLRRGRSLADLGFRRPNRWWTVPFWAMGIMVAFIVAQAAASFLLAALIDLPEPDLSRYDFIRGNLMSAIAMALVLPVAAAVPEEIVYRGFLVDRFSCLMGGEKGSAVFPVLAQAVVFGSVHFQWGVGGIVLTSIMGAVWGFALIFPRT